MITEFKIFESVKTIGPLFHGSKQKFDNFDFEKLGIDGHLLSFLGVHFSEKQEVAESFMRRSYILYEVELNVNKTLTIAEGDLVKDMIKFGVENYLMNPDDFVETPYPDVLDLNYYNSTVSHKKPLLAYELLRIPKEDCKRISLKYKELLIKKGYDSIKYKNEIEMPNLERWDWIAFDEKQIKILEIWEKNPMME